MNQPIKQMFGTAIRGYSIPQVFREKWFANFQTERLDQQTSNRYMYIIANVMNIPHTKMIVQVFLFTNKSTQLKQFFLIMVFQDDFFFV